MKATEQYFPVVLFIMLYKMVLTFESVHEILWCDHSNETPSETVQQYFLFFFTWEFGSMAFFIFSMSSTS